MFFIRTPFLSNDSMIGFHLQIIAIKEERIYLWPAAGDSFLGALIKVNAVYLSRVCGLKMFTL